MKRVTPDDRRSSPESRCLLSPVAFWTGLEESCQEAVEGSFWEGAVIDGCARLLVTANGNN